LSQTPPFAFQNLPKIQAKSFSETGKPPALALFPYQVKQAREGFEGLYPRQAVFAVSFETKIFRVPDATEQTRKVLRRELPNQMKTRFFRPIATMISLLLLVAVPAQASPIKFVDVVNVMADLQRSSQVEQLRLRVAQDPSVPLNTGASSRTSAGVAAPLTGGEALPDSAAAGATESVAPSLVAGTEVAPQQPQGNIQVFEQDNVDGTICDCGEIPSVGGGFPKWPFLFLALIPLFFIHHHNRQCPTCVTPPSETPTPTPTPTPPIPEPASLLLLGSGLVALSASARRRYAKMRASKQAAAMTEV